MRTWLEDIVEAMSNLGGIARYSDLYSEIERLRGKDLPAKWDATVRKVIETHSSDSKNFKGKDIFFSLNGIGEGVWGLLDWIDSTPKAPDISEYSLPERHKCEIYRILRDTKRARGLKFIYRNKCQICNEAVEVAGGDTYAEAHHIRPLGNPHNGPDEIRNMLVLCPNHHVQCDYNFLELKLSSLHIHPLHTIDQIFLDYHNERVAMLRGQRKSP